MALCKEVSAWRECSAKLGKLYNREDSIEVADALEIIDDANLSTFDGQRCYKNVRLIRALCLLMNKPMKDTVESWKILRSMSASVSEKLKSYGAFSYEGAMKFRDSLRSRLNEPRYTLNDLVCFVCCIDSAFRVD